MLTVKIFSFSYFKSGVPEDASGNGGGFVFDCRFIYNPGKLLEFKHLTGKDKEVAGFLDLQQEMQKFLTDVKSMISAAIENYLFRDFTNLMVSFGCTGGQHRSVYSAEQIKKFINEKYPGVKVELKHLEII